MPETAKKQFAETIEWLRALTMERMKTREGRDDIRATFGCGIEGYEDEEVDGIPPGMFNSPML